MTIALDNARAFSSLADKLAELAARYDGWKPEEAARLRDDSRWYRIKAMDWHSRHEELMEMDNAA